MIYNDIDNKYKEVRKMNEFVEELEILKLYSCIDTIVNATGKIKVNNTGLKYPVVDYNYILTKLDLGEDINMEIFTKIIDKVTYENVSYFIKSWVLSPNIMFNIFIETNDENVAVATYLSDIILSNDLESMSVKFDIYVRFIHRCQDEQNIPLYKKEDIEKYILENILPNIRACLEDIDFSQIDFNKFIPEYTVIREYNYAVEFQK